MAMHTYNLATNRKIKVCDILTKPITALNNTIYDDEVVAENDEFYNYIVVDGNDVLNARLLFEGLIGFVI